MLKNFITNKSGASMIEYGLLAGLVSVAAIVALQGLGSTVNDVFVKVNTEMRTAL